MAERLGISQSAYAQQESSSRLRKASREKIAGALGIEAAQLDFEASKRRSTKPILRPPDDRGDESPHTWCSRGTRTPADTMMGIHHDKHATLTAVPRRCSQEQIERTIRQRIRVNT